MDKIKTVLFESDSLPILTNKVNEFLNDVDAVSVQMQCNDDNGIVIMIVYRVEAE